ncbi:TonB-dependent receptor [Colwellia sp. UCD-KL20]|uniref:TonB-dependent receptor n=1 Tax=Colwellia sp. UCD-KL20 TaxID=1917165 RepID=UPI00097148B4|nr:TonB-dependent receptor [Colwellia sp. UCD-KL20]
MTNQLSTIALAISSVLFSQTIFAEEANTTAIEVITVKGDFRETSLQKIPNAISILSEEDIKRRNAQNLEEVLALTPNVNFSSGSQRARYYQIRGIGERSQFSEPINPSVGVIIDNVEFTGIGSVSSLFDVAQTEVFRGPQGTRFGANALAGIINIETNAPSDSFEGAVKATLGNYGSKGASIVLSGPASDKVNYRLAAEQYNSDGFIDNIYLNRDDVNNRDELSLRGKLAIEASKDLSIDLTVMHFDFDNGYDAFSLDNNRTTYSDQPGFDTQETTAIASTFNYKGLDSADVVLIASYANSDLSYGYDEDWAYGEYEYNEDDWDNGLYFPDPCITPTGCLAAVDGYSSTDHYFREKETQTVELRATSKEGDEIFNGSTSWVTGVYYKQETSDLTRIYTYASDFSSTFDTETLAAYAELATVLTDNVTLTTGLRVENREADYNNSTDFSAKPSDTMIGGKIVLAYQTQDSLIYASINRGYKAGGVNTDGTLEDNQREFDPEFVMNYELGFKATYLDGDAYLRAAAFYMDRKDVQVKISYQVEQAGEFIEFLSNASQGKNLGVEIESGWQATDSLDIYGSLGLLDTEYEDFSYQTEDGLKSLSGREQAHAPSYQFNIGANFAITENLLLNVSIEGKDSFYFSDSHDKESHSYELLNASITYSQDEWDVSLWARNITDEEYQVRGFEFPNDPRDGYTTSGYTQLGEPAVFGVTFNYNF